MTNKEKEIGGTALLERPEEKHVERQPATPKTYEDDDLVTVLHGWGRVRLGEKHFVDKILFEDGVARNVPYSIAKYWLKGSRPDGKEAHGRVKVQILPPEANQDDFVKATGLKPLPTKDLANQIAGIDLAALVEALGNQRAKELVAGLQSYIPKQ